MTMSGLEVVIVILSGINGALWGIQGSESWDVCIDPVGSIQVILEAVMDVLNQQDCLSRLIKVKEAAWLFGSPSIIHDLRVFFQFYYFREFALQFRIPLPFVFFIYQANIYSAYTQHTHTHMSTFFGSVSLIAITNPLTCLLP